MESEGLKPGKAINDRRQTQFVRQIPDAIWPFWQYSAKFVKSQL